MADKEVLIKEFEAIQVRYRELMAQLVSMKIPAVLDASAGACDTGEWCCTGTESVDPSWPGSTRSSSRGRGGDGHGRERGSDQRA